MQNLYNDFLQSSLNLCQVKSDNCLGWSPTIPRLVTNQPKDGHPPEGSMLQTQNLTLRLKSQNVVSATWLVQRGLRKVVCATLFVHYGLCNVVSALWLVLCF